MLNFKKMTTIGTASVVALLAGGAAQAAEGFANGGFELAAAGTPNPGSALVAAGWATPLGQPPAVRSSEEAHSGSFSAKLSVPNGFNASVLFQNNVADGGMPALTVGDTPSLSFWIKGVKGETADVAFNLRYLAPNGGILENNGGFHSLNASISSTWKQVTFQGAAVPAGAVAAFLLFNDGLGPIIGPTDKVYIDDVSLSVAGAVPEPETYALMLAGLAGVGAMVRRRRA